MVKSRAILAVLLICIVLCVVSCPADAVVRSTQQILNELYDSGKLLSVDQIFNAVYDAGWKPGSIYRVATSGADYTTVQSAVTAAAAKASATNPILVAYYPGVNITYTPAPNVIVAPVAQMAAMAYGNLPAQPGEMPIQKIQTPYDAPLVVIRSDDILAGWVTVDAGGTLTYQGANVSPLEYAWSKGFPITFAAPTDLIGVEHYQSAAQIKTGFQCRGAEYAPHTKGHIAAVTPTDYGSAWRETVGAKQALEALAVSGTRIGLRCRGWIQSGEFTGDANIDSYAKTTNYVSQILRQQFEWSMAYNPAVASRENRHLGGSILNNTNFLSTCPSDVSGPGRDIVIQMHGFTSDTGSYLPMSLANFKTMIDRIAAWRDAGLAYPVTLSTYFSAITQAPVYNGVTRLAPKWLGVPYGDFEGVTTLDGTQWPSGSAGVSINASGGNPGKCIDITGDWPSLQMKEIEVYPGRSHMLRFDAKLTSGATGRLHLIAVYKYKDVNNQDQYANANLTDRAELRIVPTADWKTYFVPVGVPDWCIGLSISFQTVGTGFTVSVDNVGIALG